MIPILGGLAAALCWGSSAVVASRSTRMIGSQQALAYVMLIGLVVTGVIALAIGPPTDASGDSIVWAVAAGFGSGLGLAFLYRALQLGKVGVVTPIASTEGALAAIFSIVFLDETLTLGVALCLAVIAFGVVIVTMQGSRADVHLSPSLYALAAACAFGVGLVSSSQAGRGLGPFWTLLIARIIGVGLIAVPLIVRGRLPRPGAALWMVTFSGLAELAGYAAYIRGARSGAAIPAVLGSQFAAVAAVGSYLVYGERLTRRQVWGAVVIVSGVAVLALLRG